MTFNRLPTRLAYWMRQSQTLNHVSAVSVNLSGQVVSPCVQGRLRNAQTVIRESGVHDHSSLAPSQTLLRLAVGADHSGEFGVGEINGREVLGMRKLHSPRPRVPAHPRSGEVDHANFDLVTLAGERRACPMELELTRAKWTEWGEEAIAPREE